MWRLPREYSQLLGTDLVFHPQCSTFIYCRVDPGLYERDGWHGLLLPTIRHALHDIVARKFAPAEPALRVLKAHGYRYFRTVVVIAGLR